VSDQYDVVAEVYERVKSLPVGLAEQSTLLDALPDLSGKSVLDVGTGTGFYPRIFKHKGAGRVVGVDASQAMIAYARRVEEREPLGIEYEVHDGGALPKLGEFDVVTAVWLLGYAEGVDALDQMLANLLANLTPGGTLVAMVGNPDLDRDGLDEYHGYGLSATKTEGSFGREGYTIGFDGDPPIQFVSYLWPSGVIEAAFARAKLSDVRRQPVSVPAHALAERGERYWAALLANPTFAVFSGTRP